MDGIGNGEGVFHRWRFTLATAIAARTQNRDWDPYQATTWRRMPGGVRAVFAEGSRRAESEPWPASSLERIDVLGIGLKGVANVNQQLIDLAETEQHAKRSFFARAAGQLCSACSNTIVPPEQFEHRRIMDGFFFRQVTDRKYFGEREEALDAFSTRFHPSEAKWSG